MNLHNVLQTWEDEQLQWDVFFNPSVIIPTYCY